MQRLHLARRTLSSTKSYATEQGRRHRADNAKPKATSYQGPAVLRELLRLNTTG